MMVALNDGTSLSTRNFRCMADCGTLSVLQRTGFNSLVSGERWRVRGGGVGLTYLLRINRQRLDCNVQGEISDTKTALNTK